MFQELSWQELLTNNRIPLNVAIFSQSWFLHPLASDITLFFTSSPGIASSSGEGFEGVNPEDLVTLVQVMLQKCLEKEAYCNEFYLQLLKQTTEQPGKDWVIDILRMSNVGSILP